MAHRKRRDLIGPLPVRKQTYPLTPWVDSWRLPERSGLSARGPSPAAGRQCATSQTFGKPWRKAASTQNSNSLWV